MAAVPVEGVLSFAATSLSAPSIVPVYTESAVSNVEPTAENVAVPVLGAVHENHVERMPLRFPCEVSPPCAVRPAATDVEPDPPLSTRARSNESGVVAPDALWSASSADGRSSRGNVSPTRASKICTGLVRTAAFSAEEEAVGAADARIATAAVTWGAAWEVPAELNPPAVITAPGASKERFGPVWEKRAILSSDVV